MNERVEHGFGGLDGVDMDVDGTNNRGLDLDLNVPLDMNGNNVEVVYVSSDDSGDEMEIVDGQGEVIVVSSDDSGDDLEIPDHEHLGKGKGKDDEVARPFSELWWLITGDDLFSLETWVDKAYNNIKEEIRVRLSGVLQPNIIPVMPEPVVERDTDDHRRRHMRETARLWARPEHPIIIRIGTKKESLVDVKEFEQFKNSVGPFSEAIMDIRMRTSKTAAEDLIKWEPLVQIRDRSSLAVPSLLQLSLKAITENADGLVSLESIPYLLRKKLSDIMCDMRKIDVEYFNLLLKGCPDEIRVKNCSFLTDEQFQKSFESCRTKNLKVLQLDLCGQCMFDYALRNIRARSSNTFRSLVIISLRGACRLTDIGIKLLVRSARSLLSINLGLCPLLTFEAIACIADYLGSKLRELYIDGCDQIDAGKLTPAIKKFKKLEVFSVAEIRGVSDKFICLLVMACGRSIKELDVAKCSDLTDASLKAIGDFCTGLCSLNISGLCEATDLGMEYLANRCRPIQKLKLSDTRFSDEAIAAFLEISGKSLVELSLNHVVKVGPNTAFSLARRSRKLLYLDMSWCRRISENALGLIVDNCSSLKLLKLFGFSRQITKVFLNGHSNSQVNIVGLELDSLVDHLNLLEPEEVFLRYSPLPTSS